MNSTRRQILTSAGIFGALFLTRGLVACALPGESVGGSGEALTTCGDAVIARNHGHSLVVSSEDVAAGVEKTYGIKGASSHDHQVTVTASDFAALAAGGSITIASSTDVGHSHAVTVTCAVSARPESDAGGDADAAPSVCPNGATAATISSNHGHVLVVPTEDVIAGIEKTYGIKGTSSHPHTVTLGAKQLAQLAAGATVIATSSTDSGHAHIVKVICA